MKNLLIQPILVLALINLFIAIRTSWSDYTKIYQETPIFTKFKNKRATIIGAINMAMAILIVINFRLPWFYMLPITIYAQVWYGTMFDLWLNRRRNKSILYTSNNEYYKNMSWTDGIFNRLPYPYSGIVQLIVKASLIGRSLY